MLTTFTGEAFALLGVALLVIFLRLGTRINAVGAQNLAADDYLMLLAAVSLPKFNAGGCRC